MDTRQIATELRLQHWAGIMRERKEKGLSVRQWCRENGVGEKTYYYWQRKLRETVCRELLPGKVESDNQAVVPSGWAKCEPEPKADETSGAVIIEIGKCRITATSSTDPELLGKVCRALTSQC